MRTLVPFVAGMTRMEFHRYLAFAALAAVLWVTIFLGAGYLFGNIQWVQDYLAVALAIAVAASAIPGFIIWAVHHLRGALRRAELDHAGGRSGSAGLAASPRSIPRCCARVSPSFLCPETDDHW